MAYEECTTETRIKSTRDAFFKFYVERSLDLPKACERIVKSIKFVEGGHGGVDTPGCVKLMSIQSSTETVEKIQYKVTFDANLKKIDYEVLEGPMRQYYDLFIITLEVTVGSTAKRTIKYQNRGPDYRKPEHYLNLLSALDAQVDQYIS